VQDIPLSPGDPAWSEVLAAERATWLLADRPVFLGWGERDPVFRRAFREEWLRRFPHAVSRTYADAGHYVLEDKAAELVDEIRAFLA
jgi:cis-3-alkyl-4-acyloxetan-2-one decarboxylase